MKSFKEAVAELEAAMEPHAETEADPIAATPEAWRAYTEACKANINKLKRLMYPFRLPRCTYRYYAPRAADFGHILGVQNNRKGWSRKQFKGIGMVFAWPIRIDVPPTELHSFLEIWAGSSYLHPNDSWNQWVGKWMAIRNAVHIKTETIELMYQHCPIPNILQPECPRNLNVFPPWSVMERKRENGRYVFHANLRYKLCKGLLYLGELIRSERIFHQNPELVNHRVMRKLERAELRDDAERDIVEAGRRQKRLVRERKRAAARAAHEARRRAPATAQLVEQIQEAGDKFATKLIGQ